MAEKTEIKQANLDLYQTASCTVRARLDSLTTRAVPLRSLTTRAVASCAFESCTISVGGYWPQLEPTTSPLCLRGFSSVGHHHNNLEQQGQSKETDGVKLYSKVLNFLEDIDESHQVQVFCDLLNFHQTPGCPTVEQLIHQLITTTVLQLIFFLHHCVKFKLEQFESN